MAYPEDFRDGVMAVAGDRGCKEGGGGDVVPQYHKGVVTRQCYGW